ncbi:MAG: DNA primase [Candidatus Doudnabacteria bacterium]|nr:DNA primase [Candidatus Doudnabacteria bacterium]
MADQVIQQIKDKLDIAEVISGYMSLKKAGVNFKGLCPFHSEKSPSFVVTPARQIWHCFGCGEGGDVFTFVEKFENLDFAQTLKLLAERAGVKLPEYKPGSNQVEDEKEILVRVNAFAAKYYHQTLLSSQGKEALEYLFKRGLSKKTIEDWQIGYAPEGYTHLTEALKKKNVSESLAIKAGLLIKQDSGRVYDRFRGRITFPIFNYVGEAVGFSARILPKFDDGKTGKYINSPETLVYSKSRVLFGLNFAKNHIRKADEVVVVEGQMDCISAYQAGFLNTVASSGTALTLEHLTVLGRLTKNIKFCFDADNAGLNATKRAVEHILGKDFTIKVVELGGGFKDPDELIRKDARAFEKVVKEAPMFLDFYIARLFSSINILSLENKKKLKADILPVIIKLPSAMEREHYVRVLASKLEVTPGALMEDLNALKQRGFVKKSPVQKEENVKNDFKLVAEKMVLGGMLTEKEFMNLVLKNAQVEDFSDPVISHIVKSLFLEPKPTQDVLGSVVAKESVFMVELLKEESSSDEAFYKDLTKAFFALRTQTLLKERNNLQAKILAAEKDSDLTRVMVLQKEFARISKVINSYKS